MPCHRSSTKQPRSLHLLPNLSPSSRHPCTPKSSGPPAAESPSPGANRLLLSGRHPRPRGNLHSAATAALVSFSPLPSRIVLHLAQRFTAQHREPLCGSAHCAVSHKITRAPVYNRSGPIAKSLAAVLAPFVRCTRGDSRSGSEHRATSRSVSIYSIRNRSGRHGRARVV